MSEASTAALNRDDRAARRERYEALVGEISSGWGVPEVSGDE